MTRRRGGSIDGITAMYSLESIPVPTQVLY